MASSKTDVIEYLFFTTKAFVPDSGLGDPVVTFDEVAAAIEAVNPALEAAGRKKLSTRNPANFWKDITRHNPASIWPQSVLGAGFTGDDAIGQAQGACFRFVPVTEGTPLGFEAATEPTDRAFADTIVLESLSMPLATKSLGRTDENWLAQVAARLRIIETHFAAVSEFEAAEITFLQTGIKLGQSEVDAAYVLTDASGGRWLLAVEAKGRRDKIHLAQILRGATNLLVQAKDRGQQVDGVIPMAIKIIGESKVHVVEFEPITDGHGAVAIASDSVFELRPPVTGIG